MGSGWVHEDYAAPMTADQCRDRAEEILRDAEIRAAEDARAARNHAYRIDMQDRYGEWP